MPAVHWDLALCHELANRLRQPSHGPHAHEALPVVRIDTLSIAGAGAQPQFAMRGPSESTGMIGTFEFVNDLREATDRITPKRLGDWSFAAIAIVFAQDPHRAQAS